MTNAHARPRPGSTARAAPTSRGTSSATHHQRARPRAEFGIDHHLRLLGLGGRALFALVGHRPADRAGHRRRRLPRSCWPARMRWTEHFRTAPLEQNLPVLLGLLDVWYRNFHGFTSRSIAPYHSGLQRAAGLPAAARDGKQRQAVDMRAASRCRSAPRPVLWGEPGTNGQHAYFQMLHQGTDVMPVEFIAVQDGPRTRSAGPPHQAAGQRARAGARR